MHTHTSATTSPDAPPGAPAPTREDAPGLVDIRARALPWTERARIFLEALASAPHGIPPEDFAVLIGPRGDYQRLTGLSRSGLRLDVEDRLPDLYQVDEDGWVHPRRRAS